MTSAERWLPVPGYEGLYEVSDLGRVKTLPRQGSRGGVRKLHLGPRGYLILSLCRNRRYSTKPVHQLVAAAFLGPRPLGMETRHLDGNALNNELSNLAYGTPSENRYDQVRHGAHHYASRDRCSNGHEYTPDNLIVRRRSGRGCRACLNEYNRQYRRRKKAQTEAFIAACNAADRQRAASHA